ncbi:MAG TPA: DEAD/DEAH box helicase [Gemmatimonadaceae bacterium]|nr:DEAD/DEAH box helicase [Gemmatimonadaceae bacterium]
MPEFRLAPAAEVRAIIAHLMLGDTAGVLTRLGAITLQPHQRDGVVQIERVLRQHGGALLADDVGMGKTYVALAVARRYERTLVVAPAALRDTWLESAKATGITADFASTQSLFRGLGARCAPDFVIIDEAHHFRSRATRRFATAAALCAHVPVLLISATPIQNSVDDLRAVLSLFLGTRAFALEAAALARFLVRRRELDLALATRPRLPALSAPVALPPIDDLDYLPLVAALPPPLPPADSGDAGILLTYTLARQWSSSRAAFRAALRRRVARARAMEDALATGRLPTNAELQSWHFDGEAQQLAFAELTVANGTATAAEMATRVRAHARAVQRLLETLDETPDPDVARAQRILALRAAHARQPIVAFSEYTETVQRLYHLLSRHGRVALLTHRGVRIAGGRMTRRELLRQFGADCDVVPDVERIDVLLTTDLLSEGVNLQGAGVVVHLDLAWNPARLDQRVGRLRRIGSRHESVATYVMLPPVAAERLLRLEERLRAKLDVAAARVGLPGNTLPAPRASAESDVARRTRIDDILRGWVHPRYPDDLPLTPVAVVRGDRDVVIACVEAGDDARLRCIQHGTIADSDAAILSALSCADDADIMIASAEVARIVQQVRHALRGADLTSVISLPEVRLARTRRAVLQRIERIGRRAPRHARSGISPLLHAARGVATATLTAGAEKVLHELANAPLDDCAWLRAIREFAGAHGSKAATRIRALLVIRQR